MVITTEELESLLTNCREILELAEAHHDQRKGIEPRQILVISQKELKRIDELLARAYALSYLEAKLHCDAYLEGKGSLKDMGETYGYLHSRVEMNNGSIDAYFQEIRPNNFGSMNRERVRKGKDGYSEIKLKRYAAHDTEAEMALMTEEHYERIRRQASAIKEMRKRIRSLEIFNPNIEP